MSASSISFWHQDLNWYIRQQSWTKSFNQVDRNWTNELFASSRAGTVSEPINQSSSASIVDQGIVNLVSTQSEPTTLTSALRASNAKSGSLLDLLV